MRVVVLAALGAAACGTPEQRGQRLFAERGCAVCHGTAARGDGPSAGRLDVPPRDLADVRAYAQGATRKDIAASIRNGAGAMPPFRDISESEADDIAAWLLSLRRPPQGGR